jgi:hypothetical protein
MEAGGKAGEDKQIMTNSKLATARPLLVQVHFDAEPVKPDPLPPRFSEA